jgi:hypothetical protein
VNVVLAKAWSVLPPLDCTITWPFVKFALKSVLALFCFVITSETTPIQPVVLVIQLVEIESVPYNQIFILLTDSNLLHILLY